MYSVQKGPESVVCTPGKIEQLIDIQMFMSIVQLAYYMYWQAETRYPQVADAMSLHRYKLLRKYLHVSDNSKRDGPANKDNKLFKIKPVLNHVRTNCMAIEPEIKHSIDERIIPAKTTYSGIRQYNPKKPVKWGFKNFVRFGESGIIYEIFYILAKKIIRNAQENLSS